MRPAISALLLAIALSCVSALPAAAQTSLAPHPAIGLKAGLAWSRWSVPGTGTSNRSGPAGGAFVRLPLASVAVQTEILWSEKGFQKRSYDGYSDIELKTSNFEIPVAVVVELPARAVHLYLMGGMSFGIITGTQIRHAGSDGWESVDDVLTGTNTLAILALGVRHDRVGLEFRFNHGVKNLAKSDVGGEIKDEGFAVTVSYALWD